MSGEAFFHDLLKLLLKHHIYLADPDRGFRSAKIAIIRFQFRLKPVVKVALGVADMTVFSLCRYILSVCGRTE